VLDEPPVPVPEELPVPVPEELPVPVPEELPVPVPEELPVPVPEELPVPVPDELPVPVPEELPVPVSPPPSLPVQPYPREATREATSARLVRRNSFVSMFPPRDSSGGAHDGEDSAFVKCITRQALEPCGYAVAILYWISSRRERL
jgi:hypothetical protein